MNVEKELFDLFSKIDDRYALYKEILKFIHKQEHYVLGKENAMFYDVFRRLGNSINNAGHEDRRSDDIRLIAETSGAICDKYEDFLP